MAGDDAGHFGQLLARQRAQRIFPGVEQDIRHVHDQTAHRVPGLKNGIELSQQLRSQFRFLRLGPRLRLCRAIQLVLSHGALCVVLAFQTVGFVLRGRRRGVVLQLQTVGFGLRG